MCVCSCRFCLTLVLLNPDIPCLCKQCSSRSVGFWRSQLIWICTVCHLVCEFIATIRIKVSDWLKIKSGRGILIYSAGQGLTNRENSRQTIGLKIHLFILYSAFTLNVWTSFKALPYCYWNLNKSILFPVGISKCWFSIGWLAKQGSSKWLQVAKY